MVVVIEFYGILHNPSSNSSPLRGCKISSPPSSAHIKLNAMKHLHPQTVKVVNTQRQVVMAAAGSLLKVIMFQDKPISPLPAH